MSVLILDSDYDELLKLRRKNRKNKKLQEKCKRLTNNWNELEELLIKGTKEEPYERGDMFFREFCEIILDKMEEIKEGNK